MPDRPYGVEPAEELALVGRLASCVVLVCEPPADDEPPELVVEEEEEVAPLPPPLRAVPDGLPALTSAVPVIDVWPIALVGTASGLLTALIPVIEGWRIGVALPGGVGRATVGEAGAGLVLDTVGTIVGTVTTRRGATAAEWLGAAACDTTPDRGVGAVERLGAAAAL